MKNALTFAILMSATLVCQPLVRAEEPLKTLKFIMVDTSTTGARGKEQRSLDFRAKRRFLWCFYRW
jgi:hypothetical protein